MFPYSWAVCVYLLTSSTWRILCCQQAGRTMCARFCNESPLCPVSYTQCNHSNLFFFFFFGLWISKVSFCGWTCMRHRLMLIKARGGFRPLGAADPPSLTSKKRFPEINMWVQAPGQLKMHPISLKKKWAKNVPIGTEADQFQKPAN